MCAALIIAEDSVGPPSIAAPIPIHVSANGPSVIGIRPGQPSEATGGVTITYEAVKIVSDSMSCRSDAYPGTSNPVLVEAKLLGGSAGPPDGRVLIDTTQSKLPQVSFKGELHPATVVLQRQKPLEAQPQMVHFQLEATDVGDFNGLMTTIAGERQYQYVIWADHIILDLEAPLDARSSTGMGNPRLRAMHMYGRPARDGQPARSGTVMRMPAGKIVAKEEAVVDRLFALKAYGACGAAMTQSLLFDEQGNLIEFKSSYLNMDKLDGEDLVPKAPPQQMSQPKIVP